MKTKLHHIFLLITALGLVSCSTATTRGFPERVEDPGVELAELKTDFQTAKKTYSTLNNDEDRKRIRNEIINGRIAAIDIQFALFQQELHEQDIGLNVGTDAITIGLGAAGALASGGTSQILSAASAAIIGLKGSIDKNAFFEQTMPALFAQMIAQRKKVLVKIRTGLGSNTTDYPLQQGLADLEDYLYAGSIPGSIATIVEDAGTTSAQATKDLNEIFDWNQLDDNAKKLKDNMGKVGSDQSFDTVKVQKLKKCMEGAKVPVGTLFIDLIKNPELKEKRLEVSECLNKP